MREKVNNFSKSANENMIPILIVEDDPGLRRLIGRALHRHGFIIKNAASGTEALKALEKEHEVLILLDYHLPDISGKDVLEAINAQFGPIPFIIMTGYGDEKLAVAMMKLGARDYLVKEAGFLEFVPEIVRKVQEELMREKLYARTEHDLYQRERALQLVYRLATENHLSFQELCEQTALDIAELLKVPFVAVSLKSDPEISAVAVYENGVLVNSGKEYFKKCEECVSSVVQSRRTIINNFDIIEVSPCAVAQKYKSFVGVPVINDQMIFGAICTFDNHLRYFKPDEIRLIEIFARYIAHEISRIRMQRILQRAEEMKILGQLTSGVAHEVRNPLNAISALVETLMDEIGENEDIVPFRDHLQNQVQRLTKLMEDLLSLGKPLRSSELTRVSPYTFCAKSVQLWRESKDEQNRKIEIITEPEAEQIKLEIDPDRMHQVFINLLDNAAQNSEPCTTITLRIELYNSIQCKILIIDKGQGISKEDKTRIFQPFFTRRKKGTGLGLSIVKNIVNLHNGTIAIYNNDPPPGCTVEITLPLAK